MRIIIIAALLGVVGCETQRNDHDYQRATARATGLIVGTSIIVETPTQAEEVATAATAALSLIEDGATRDAIEALRDNAPEGPVRDVFAAVAAHVPPHLPPSSMLARPDRDRIAALLRGIADSAADYLRWHGR